MPSFGQFELLEPIRIAAVETWLAREGNSERLLLLHKFSCDSGLRERLLSMRPQDLIVLMRAGEENGVCFVVTYDSPELRDFSRWVDERTAPAPKPVPTPSSAPPTGEPGEFTRMFQHPPSSPRPSQPQRPIPADPSLEPSDFTRVFQTPNVAPSQPQRSATAQGSLEPGEFTRMFQSPAPASSSPQPQSPSPIKATNEPGEFTKFFNNPLSESTLPQGLNKPTSDLPTPEPPRDPGEFTRHFGPQSFDKPLEKPASPPWPPAAVPVERPPNGSATGAFSVSLQGTPVTASSTSGPGEYTRMFDRPTKQAEPPAIPVAPAGETNAPAAAPIPTQRNYMPLVLILSLLVIAALALILYFLLRR